MADLKRAELRAAGQPDTLLKKRIECNGQVISANLYLEDDLPLFEAAFVSKHFQDASVSVRENGKKYAEPELRQPCNIDVRSKCTNIDLAEPEHHQKEK